MNEAVALARRSAALASPNPAVGCVLVKGNRVVGEGYHEYDKLDHAEIVALRQAGEQARGATAYVTLEPCSHQGRTGPCALALKEAEVVRVVAATTDPNPKVNGRGLQILREAGIEVSVGTLMREARAINDGFARYIRSGLPLVNLKAGLSLDGRIAPMPGKTPPGSPVYITGEESLAIVQQMRHDADAVLTGINTVLDDNPMLTDRSRLPRRRPLLRVVLDSALRIRLDSKLVRTAKDDLLVFCTAPNLDRRRALEALGIRVEQVEAGPGISRVPLKRVIERLGEMKVLRVLFEGGSQINSSALMQQVADKLTLFYAPVLLGARGVPLVADHEASMPRLIRTELDTVGQDFRFEAYLRDPWA